MRYASTVFGELPRTLAASGAASRARLARSPVHRSWRPFSLPCSWFLRFRDHAFGVGDEVRVSVHENRGWRARSRGCCRCRRVPCRPPDRAASPSRPRRRESTARCSRTRTGAGNHRAWAVCRLVATRARPASRRGGTPRRHARGDRIAGGGDEERGTVVSEAFAGPLVAFQQFGGDLVAHGQPAAATGLGIDHVDGTGLVVDVPDASLLTSRVRSPQQAMSMKNARDCHAHGDGDSNVPAARRNRAASRSVSRYGVGRGDPAFHWSESTYASGSWASRIHLPKSLMYENHERQPPGFASILWAIHRSTTPRSRRTAPCSRQCRSNERRTWTRVAPCLPMDALKRCTPPIRRRAGRRIRVPWVS